MRQRARGDARRGRVAAGLVVVAVALLSLCAAVDPLEDTAWTEERRSVVKIHPQTNEGTNNADFGADDGVESDNTADPALDVVDDEKVSEVEHRREEWKASREKRKWKEEMDQISKLNTDSSHSSWFRKQMDKLNKLRAKLLVKKLENRKLLFRKRKGGKGKLPADLVKKIREQVKDNPALKKHLQKAFKHLNASVILLEQQADESEPKRGMDDPDMENLTPKEDFETVVGNVVPMVAEDTSALPIAVETDGEATYAIGTSKLGPELLTKVGTRVEIKGEPVNTADGETVVEVRGYKVLGAAGITTLK